jgi:hypothetical protein
MAPGVGLGFSLVGRLASCAKFSECQILCDSNDISPPLTDQTRVSAPFEVNASEQENKLNACFRGKPHKHTHRYARKEPRNWLIV